MTFSLPTFLVGAVLTLVQILAALPWLILVFLPRSERVQMVRAPFGLIMLRRLGVLLVLALAGGCFGLLIQDPKTLEFSGRVYGAVLLLQLAVDCFVLIFLVLLTAWPKGGAVALSAFREGLRQPLFWLLFAIALAGLKLAIFWPYFTFGEDHIMFKELGLDTVMLFSALFGVLAASLSITEEIEGRTAVTLMSKPVSRRQFLLGKFLGITLAALAMFSLLGWFFQNFIEVKAWWDKLDPAPQPPWLTEVLSRSPTGVVTDFLRGVGMWTATALDTLPGLILSFSQVMVLVALAVALATRVPMVVNLTTVLVVFFLAHLAPVLVAIGVKATSETPDGTVPLGAQILAFMSRLFDFLLPNMQSFRIDPALISDTPPPPGPFWQYVGYTTLYGVVYTSIILLFGLILFEDRDLA